MQAMERAHLSCRNCANHRRSCGTHMCCAETGQAHLRKPMDEDLGIFQVRLLFY